GAALYAYHAMNGGPRRFVQEHAFLGESASADDIARDGARRLPSEDAVVEETAARLARGETVGWVRGRFEWGPRSLGHRSLLAAPRRAEMREHVNTAVKRREPFRPFAPAVVAERAADYFPVPPGGEWPARFMQLAVRASARARAETPAVVHVDGS